MPCLKLEGELWPPPSAPPSFKTSPLTPKRQAALPRDTPGGQLAAIGFLIRMISFTNNQIGQNVSSGLQTTNNPIIPADIWAFFLLFLSLLATLLSVSLPLTPCLSHIPILCPMLLGNELMLFQFCMLATLTVCLPVLLFHSFILSPDPLLPSWFSDVFSKTQAHFSWLFLKGFYQRGAETRSDVLDDFHLPLISQVMSPKKSEPQKTIMRITNSLVCRSALGVSRGR